MILFYHFGEIELSYEGKLIPLFTMLPLATL